MNQTQAVSIIRAMGLSVRVREGEFRVTYRMGMTKAERECAEVMAYYTNDPGDAVHTARKMWDSFNQIGGF